tara:strand:+ start:65 stop:502 length:438 start_codon:yes stop_codon:yes gene_type:complete
MNKTEQKNNLLNKLEDLKTHLKFLPETEEKTLKNFVINYIIETEYKTDEEIKGFFDDLFKGGCQNGFISDLIYYKDTNKFFDDYEDEIETLISQNMEDFGIKTRPLFINSLNGSAENITQEKNLLSWFAFEETARSLAYELGIEV